MFEAFFPTDSSVSNFTGYWHNISWSISMLFIFPVVMGLTTKYYLEIPKLFESLSKNIPQEEKKANDFSAFITSLEKQFNNPVFPILFLIATIVLNYVYYVQILDKEPYRGWITNGNILKDFLYTKSGFTVSGLYSAIIQMTLVYWMLNLVWTSFVFSKGLIDLFNNYKFEIDVHPLHEDKCCGLKKIGNVSMIFNTILFFIGIYISLKVIDKIVIQGLPLTNDIGNPTFLACYAILAPFLFFLPLSAPHKRMREAKELFIRPLITRYTELVKSVSTQNGTKSTYEDLENLDSLIKKLDKQIPVWPFNFRSLESFFGTVVVPILPIVLPFLVKAIENLINKGF